MNHLLWLGIKGQQFNIFKDSFIGLCTTMTFRISFRLPQRLAQQLESHGDLQTKDKFKSLKHSTKTTYALSCQFQAQLAIP